MAINYQKVGWDTTKYFNPTNMNHMDDGIKAACDKSDANEAAISEVNSKLGNTDISAIGDGTVTGGLNALNSNFTWSYIGAVHKGVPISYPSEFNELYVLVDYGMFGVYDEVTVIKNFLNNPRTIQRGSSEKTGFELVFGTNNVKLQWVYIETQVPENAEITLFCR